MGTNFLGLLAAVSIGIWAIQASAVNTAIYYNAIGFVLVLGGTMAVSVYSYRISELIHIFKISWAVLFKPKIESSSIIRQLLIISQQRAPRGTLQSTFAQAHPFITDGLRLIDNDFKQDDIEEIMSAMIIERRQEFLREIEIINTLAKYPPALGMMGTILGLVAMLSGLGESAATSNIGPSMAIALVTTLYGLMLSNYIFAPLADNLSNRLRSEMAMRRIVLKGILLLNQGEDSVYIEESLNAHVLPKHRVQNSANSVRMAA